MASRPLLAVLLALALAPPRVDAADEAAGVRAWRVANEAAILAEFTAFLRLPNVATDAVAIRRNAEALRELLEARGLAPRLLEAPGSDAPPAVYGEWRVPGATRTLVFYAHYDGQAVDAADWASDPWTPTWRDGAIGDGAAVITPPAQGPFDPDWRLYARSASDDKAGVMAILAAVSALRASGLAPTVDVKLFFDGEEEQGSPHLAAILTAHRETLAADLWVIADGPLHPSERRQVVYGVRGDANVDLTVYGPKRPLHSGHYGNWAPNPALTLARLLASMKDADGRVTVTGWEDDVRPLGEAERRALAEAPRADEALRAELGLAATEHPGESLLETVQRPSLNINGIRAADVHAQARNVIPTVAHATLDLRLVAGNTPQRQFERLVAHARSQGFLVLDRDPTDAERRTHPRIVRMTLLDGAYPAARTPMDLPLAQAVAAAVQSVSPEPVVQLPSLGGSLPLSVIETTLGAPTITVPLANHDNNQHAENENLRLGALWGGIEVMAALLRMTPPAD